MRQLLAKIRRADAPAEPAAAHCNATRTYAVVNDRPHAPLNGQRATCANRADRCDGAHFDAVHGVLWAGGETTAAA